MTSTEVDVVTGEIVAPRPAMRRDTFGILGDAIALADFICNTEMVPAALRGRPDAIGAVVLAGHELGLGPMQSLQTIDLIQGRPALSPEGMRALILSHGHGLDIEAHEGECTVSVRRREWAPEHPWRTFTFSMVDAERAGLLGKDNWNRYPRAMLTARATGEAARALFADVIAGISYTPDELDVLPATAPPRVTPREATAPAEGECAVEGAEELVETLRTADERIQRAFRSWRESQKHPQYPRDPEMLAEWRAELAKIRAEEERDSLDPPIRPRDPEPPVGSPID